jgi:4-hydroxybenzoate polyprenyltransferase
MATGPQHPAARPARVSALTGWLQLVRLPNLLTVPGDPLAGALLTGAALDWRPAVASVCFYAAGLISNDLFDAAADARDRPDRPIPSGTVSRTAAGIVAGALAVTGLALAPTIIGVALLAAILLYNTGGKRIPVFGPINMGACRGLSFMLGAAAFHPAAGLLALYIAVVTGIARHEMTAPPGAARWLPAFVLAGGFALLHPTPVAILAVVVAWGGGRMLSEGHASAWPPPGTDAQKRVPPVIGIWISALLPVQAAFCADANPVVAAVLLALWPVFRVLSRKFYAS